MKTNLLSEDLQKSSKVSFPQITIIIFIAGISFLLSGLYLSVNFYQGKIFPNTTIDNTDVSGLTALEATQKLTINSREIAPHQLKITIDDISVTKSSSDLEVFKDYPKSIKKAYENGRSQSKLKTLRGLITSFYTKNTVLSETQYNKVKLDELVQELYEKTLISGKNPSISLGKSSDKNSLTVFKGSPGRSLDIAGTKEAINNKLGDNEKKSANKITSEDLYIVGGVIASTSSVLSDAEVNLTKEKANKFINKTLELKADNKIYVLNDTDLIALILPLKEYSESKIDEIISNWSKDISQEIQDAELEYDQKTLEVKKFKPPKDGLKLDQLATKKIILAWLTIVEKQQEKSQEKSTLELPLKRTKPDTNLKDTNDLGINEVIGFGESYYKGSIPNRVHNVGLASQRLSLAIVAPGKEFSFNKTLGEISEQSGYRSAYIISGGKTILGDGGGVCQVSTTLFRALLDSGLKISKRLQHSYRVSYYELNAQPGFDATVYSGEVDLRFVNDTDKYILIYSFVDEKNRYMSVEIYGTDDGRTTKISNYKKWDIKPPAPTEYYSTTELPAGTTKQIDWAVSGIKTEFTNTIKDKDGNIKSEDTYYSNYRPWAAKFRKGV